MSRNSVVVWREMFIYIYLQAIERERMENVKEK
jgi:hypothetical protein